MKALSLTHARQRLLRTALLLAAVLLVLLLVQTLGGKHGSQTAGVWAWVLGLWLPLLFTLFGLQWLDADDRRADSQLFGLVRGGLYIYGILFLAIILLEPLPVIAQSLFGLLSKAAFGLLPFLILLLALTLRIFLKPSGSARETLEILPPQEREQVLNDFKPVAARVRQAIAENKVEQALIELRTFCADHNLPEEELILLENQWSKNEKLRRLNTEDPAVLNRESNRIAQAILDGMDEILP
jgi:hypothetical protein